jgi:hypothetical protein
LFPAETFAYAEAADFPKLAHVLAAWVKGTTLADGVAAQHDRRDAIKDHKFISAQADLARFGLIASPEFLADFGRVRGVGVAFTGFNEKREPRLVMAVLLGDSTALSLFARMILTVDPDVRRIASVEGVPVCQYRPFGGPSYGPDGQIRPMNASKLAEGTFEPTFAFTPGLFVIGSDRSAVADVVRRYLGKESTPSLASSADFQNGRQLKGELVLFARPAKIISRLDAANHSIPGFQDPDWLAILKLAGNPRAIPTVSGAILLKPDGWSLEVTASIAPGERSPLLECLTGTPITGPTALSAAMALDSSFTMPPAPAGAAALFNLADAVGKAIGCLGPLPSERYAGVPDVRSLIGAVQRVRMEWPMAKGQSAPLPVVVLECESATSSARWTAAVPLLVQKTLRSQAATSPVTESIGGISVSTLTTGDSGLGHVYYAVKGSHVAAGFDRSALLVALNRESQPGQTKAVAAVSVSVLALFERLGSPATSPFPTLGIAALIGPGPHSLPVDPHVTLKDVFAPMPPISASVNRAGGKLLVRIEQSQWDAVRVGVINTAVNWWERFLTDTRQPQNQFLPRGLMFDR